MIHPQWSLHEYAPICSALIKWHLLVAWNSPSVATGADWTILSCSFKSNHANWSRASAMSDGCKKLIQLAYVREYTHKIWPYLVLTYLHFRFLKWPLIHCLQPLLFWQTLESVCQKLPLRRFTQGCSHYVGPCSTEAIRFGFCWNGPLTFSKLLHGHNTLRLSARIWLSSCLWSQA
jgi:hypothetical protein